MIEEHGGVHPCPWHSGGTLLPGHEDLKVFFAEELHLAIKPDCERYLQTRLETLREQLQRVDQLAAANDLPDAILADSG